MEIDKIKNLPFRNYLMEYIVPELNEGLLEVSNVLPDDPVEFLVILKKHIGDQLIQLIILIKRLSISTLKATIEHTRQEKHTIIARIMNLRLIIF